MEKATHDRERRFRRMLWLTALVPLVLMIATSALLSLAVGKLIRNARALDRTDEVLAEAEGFEKLAVDMETGLRGYQIKGNSKYLEPYLKAEKQVPAQLARLRERVSHDPAQTQRLERVNASLEDWKDFARELVERGRNGAGLRDEETNAKGKVLFDRLRGSVEDFTSAEAKLRAQNTVALDRIERSSLRFRWAFLLAVGGLLSLFFWGELRRVAAMFRAAEAKAIQQAEILRQNKARLRLAVDSTGIGTWDWDLERDELSWSEQCKRVFGLSPQDQVTFETFLQALHPEDRPRIDREVKQALDGRCQYDVEMRVLRSDGNVRWVHSRGLVIFPNDRPEGKAARFLGTVLDITDRKEREQELRLARDELETRVAERTRELQEANARLKEVDRLKSEFLATMSHELRTPLNSIIGFTEINLRELAGPLTEEQKRQLRMVLGSAKHLLYLINDLLDLARIESGRVEPALERVDPNAVLEEVFETVRPMAANKSLALESHFSLPRELRTDRKMFFQITLNLLNNAVKFTPKGRVRLLAGLHDGQLEVMVEDTGIGIKPEQLKLLFEAFRQVEGSAERRYEGTGLGLYLSRKLARMLGGEIHVQSQFGRGSRFTFSQPVNQATEETITVTNE